MYQPRSRRLRNPDQLRRHERYHRAMGEFRNVKLDNKPQLKGRMTPCALSSAAQTLWSSQRLNVSIGCRNNGGALVFAVCRHY
jgi:hypothetical protein